MIHEYSESLYERDVAILKYYNENVSKITLCRAIKPKGFESEYVAKGSVNDEKLDCNISRARMKIFEYALCNDWQWFFTGTLDATKYDRNDLGKFNTDFAQFIRNFNRKYGLKIQYLVVPEQHTKGGWHMHGLIRGLPMELLRQFNLKEHIPKKIRQKVKHGFDVYDWTSYREKFGFNDLEPIRNHEAVSKYLTKYINKSLSTSVRQSGAHLYYCSKGLTTAVEIKRGLLNCEFRSPDYENDYVKVKWLDKAEARELENLIVNT